MKSFAPYFITLLVGALVMRRSMRARKVNLGWMWIRPVILLLLLAGAIAAEPAPDPLAALAFVVAAASGVALGYFMALHQHLTIDPQTGHISSRASTIGTALVLVLFAIRFGARQLFPELGTPGHGQMTAAANGLLVFTVAVLVTQTVMIWRRTRPLLADHKAQKAAVPDAQPAAEPAQTEVPAAPVAPEPSAQPGK